MAEIRVLPSRTAYSTPGELGARIVGGEGPCLVGKWALQHHFAAKRPQRQKILGRNASYQGNTITGLGAGGFIARRKPYEEVLAPCAKAFHVHCVACEFGLQAQTCALECAQSIEGAILEEGPENVAAVNVEPIVGAAPRDSRFCRGFGRSAASMTYCSLPTKS